MVPPKLHFLTKIYHPNIDKQGLISIDIICPNCAKWTPALSMRTVLHCLIDLIFNPNAIDFLVPEIADEMLKNKANFEQKAR